jgi:multicomponent Na+:H+ antiporter subunit E
MLRRVAFAVIYFFKFMKELTMANYQVAKLVLSPSAKLKPGFVAVPLTAATDFEITSFANSITLTPGTISVHIPDDRSVIVMHAIDVGDDLDALRQGTKDALEAPILRFTRPEARS